MDLISLLIWVIVLGAFFSVAWCGINAIGLPPPFIMIARPVVVIIILLVCLSFLSGHRLVL